MLAAWWLRLKGYRILAHRARCSRGEVDLIVRRGRTLAFVEVKQRASAEGAAWALEAQRLRRVIAAAEVLAPRHARADDELRFDAVLIVPRSWPRHLKNIWHG